MIQITKKNIFRGLFLILSIIPVIYFKEIYMHFYVYLTGSVITRIITQEWHIVVLSIVIFIAFLIPLSYRRKANWTEYGLVSAFFVSLFIEMYGIPLTILFASKYFFVEGTTLPKNVVEFNIFGVGFGMDFAMAYGALLMFIGMLLIIIGWITLYKKIKKSHFVTSGIYSYSRHPQYLGFILIILGWLIGWLTIITLFLSPLLIYKYIRVCQVEEKEISTRFSDYKKYEKDVPFFF